MFLAKIIGGNLATQIKSGQSANDPRPDATYKTICRPKSRQHLKLAGHSDIMSGFIDIVSESRHIVMTT